MAPKRGMCFHTSTRGVTLKMALLMLPFWEDRTRWLQHEKVTTEWKHPQQKTSTPHTHRPVMHRYTHTHTQLSLYCMPCDLCTLMVHHNCPEGRSAIHSKQDMSARQYHHVRHGTNVHRHWHSQCAGTRSCYWSRTYHTVRTLRMYIRMYVSACGKWHEDGLTDQQTDR